MEATRCTGVLRCQDRIAAVGLAALVCSDVLRVHRAMGLTAMVTERARAQPAPSTMVALTYTMVA